MLIVCLILLFVNFIFFFTLCIIAQFSISGSKLEEWEGSSNVILENFNIFKKLSYREERQWIASGLKVSSLLFIVLFLGLYIGFKLFE